MYVDWQAAIDRELDCLARCVPTEIPLAAMQTVPYHSRERSSHPTVDSHSHLHSESRHSFMLSDEYEPLSTIVERQIESEFIESQRLALECTVRPSRFDMFYDGKEFSASEDSLTE